MIFIGPRTNREFGLSIFIWIDRDPPVPVSEWNFVPPVCEINVFIKKFLRENVSCSVAARSLVGADCVERRREYFPHSALIDFLENPLTSSFLASPCNSFDLAGRLSPSAPQHLINYQKLEMLGSIVSRLAHYDACVNLSTLCKR